MRYYFLREDWEQLKSLIEEVRGRIRAIGREMGASCQEGAETYHDNFAFEEGERQQRMWSRRLVELMELSQNAVLVEPDGDSRQVAIGSRVRFVDELTGEEKTVTIGSYLVFEENGRVCYNSPLARALLGAKPGETVTETIAGREKRFSVLEVHASRS